MQSVIENRLATLIVEAVNLEDIEAGEIEPSASLFGFDGNSLGLDSIDALEISMAVAQEFKVQIKADDENNLKIFESLESLAKYIESKMV